MFARESPDPPLPETPSAKPSRSRQDDTATLTGPVESDAATFPAGSSLGRYTVLDRAGEGGMGRVYAAYDPKLDRKVALKLLHPRGSRNDEVRTRLLREAQALAKLSHPNVLTVYDVGSLDDQVFLAMEYVDGVTLKEWLKQQARSTQEVVEVFGQAGRGLAAAHRAGLIHRDFKPGNVMISEEGRVLVLDFGLARAEALKAEGGVVPLDELPEESGTIHMAPLEAALTHTGALLGTPAYMAPEQLAGKRADPRADQYGFCAALYHALFGQHAPGEGEPALPADKNVPAPVREVLLRGLCRRPEERFDSMEELLGTLVRDPWRRRRPWILAAAALALVAGSWWLSWHSFRQDPRCRGAEAAFGGSWAPENLEQAFLATGLPFAEAAWRATRTALEAYRGAWLEQYVETCEATHLRGEQSNELLDVRMECLSQRRQDFQALTELLSQGAPEVVERAVEAANALSPLSACAESAALMAPLRLPADEGSRQHIRELRGRLAAAGARLAAGRYDDGLEVAKAVAGEADDLGYWPLRAEAHLRSGLLLERKVRPEDATAALTRALLAAQAGRHEQVAAEAYVQLVRVAGYQQQDFDGARRYAEHAAAMLERLIQRRGLEATLADHLGVVYMQQGELEEARRHHRRALALRTELVGRDHPQVARTLTRLGNVLLEQGDWRGALNRFEEALAINERVLGDVHPEVATILHRIGTAALDLGDYDQALRSHSRELEIRRLLRGPEHSKVASSLLALGRVYSARQDYEKSIRHYRQAQSIYEATLGADHPYVALALANVGGDLLEQGHGAQAVEHYQRALAIQEEVYGSDHHWVAMTVYNLGEVCNELGDFDSARRHHERALSIRRTAFDEDHPLTADSLTGLARALRGLGRPAEGRPLLERALAILAEVEQDPVYEAVTRFELARNLLDRERERARDLAIEARGLLDGEDHRRELAEIRVWLVANFPDDTDHAP